MSEVDVRSLRATISGGTASFDVVPLVPSMLDAIRWSGSPTHLEHVRGQLDRVASGEVVYLAVLADGVPVAKGVIDFTVSDGAGELGELATHPELEGLGLASRLIAALEASGLERGVRSFQLGFEHGHERAQRLYEHLGYTIVGESSASWEAERPDGSRYLHVARVVDLRKDV
jgi:ribosomal protein S18 acetylase RimI-like enzyme